MSRNSRESWYFQNTSQSRKRFGPIFSNSRTFLSGIRTLLGVSWLSARWINSLSCNIVVHLECKFLYTQWCRLTRNQSEKSFCPWDSFHPTLLTSSCYGKSIPLYWNTVKLRVQQKYGFEDEPYWKKEYHDMKIWNRQDWEEFERNRLTIFFVEIST